MEMELLLAFGDAIDSLTITGTSSLAMFLVGWNGTLNFNFDMATLVLILQVLRISMTAGTSQINATLM